MTHSVTRAEYMLEVIGAGATAKATQDWNAIYLASPERTRNLHDIERILAESREKGAAETTHTKKIATSWPYQVQQNLVRLSRAYWREPVYILAKFLLCFVGGIILGFTFFRTKLTQQGSQNILFVRMPLFNLLN